MWREKNPKSSQRPFCVTTRLCEYDCDEVGDEDENGLLMQIIMKPWDHMREMTITKLMVPDQEKR